MKGPQPEAIIKIWLRGVGSGSAKATGGPGACKRTEQIKGGNYSGFRHLGAQDGGRHPSYTKASSLHLRESAWPGGGNGLSLAVLTPATGPPQARTESQLESPSARRGGADFCLGGAGRWGRELGNHPLPPPPTVGGDKGGNDRACVGGHRREQAGGTGAQKGIPNSVAPRSPTRTTPFSRPVPYQTNFLPSGPKHSVPPNH